MTELETESLRREGKTQLGSILGWNKMRFSAPNGPAPVSSFILQRPSHFCRRK